LKQNIQPLGTILGRVLELEPVSYQRIRAGDDSETEFGFIAQAVQELFPEMAQDHEESEYLGLNYETFSVLAIQAIQEQQAIIDGQAGQIEEFQERLTRIEAMLDGNSAGTPESQ